MLATERLGSITGSGATLTIAAQGRRYAARVSKKRLDVLMVERGLAETRSQAQALVLAGKVPGHAKAGEQVDESAEIEVEAGPRFVSRGGEKLANAIAAFGIDVEGEECLDVGASTGGFTDCLLQAGAARVCALDVGYGQLAWSLRSDERVQVHDRTNVRDLTVELIGGPVDVVVGDLSFISLGLVLEALVGVTAPDGDLAVMVKPQFEVGKDRVGKGDVLAVARIAGIQAAKRTPEWIPLAHVVPLDGVEVRFEPVPGGPGGARLEIEATARAQARTGVEMEALVAVSAAALTVYDMCKAVDRGMRIEAVAG